MLDFSDSKNHQKENFKKIDYCGFSTSNIVFFINYMFKKKLKGEIHANR